MRKSDLGVRTLTAIAMVVVAGAALWLGDWFWAVFVGLVAVGVLWEWRGLVRAFTESTAGRMAWNAGGFIYIAGACFTLLALRSDLFGDEFGTAMVLLLVGAVIATDVGAYFVGRAIGGPKIAPKISPSKTWAGLAGGIVGASLPLSAYVFWANDDGASVVPDAIMAGVLVAVIAQSGDFFESWMKRRAGVKDSGKLLPGHGGLFDRVDGLLSVCFVWGLLILGTYWIDGI